MFERFTTSAREAVVSAQESAREYRHHEIGAEQLLLGTLQDEQGVPARVLSRWGISRAAVAGQVAEAGPSDAEALGSIGIDLDQVRRQAEETFGPGALDRPRRQRRGLFGHRSTGGGHLALSSEAKSALEQSLRAAVGRKDTYIGTEHLLLGLLATERGTALRVLQQVDPSVGRDAIVAAVTDELKRSA